MTNKDKFSFENKNGKNGIVIIEGEETGKSNRPLLEDFAKRNGYPVFKGHVEHAYESDFTKQKKTCPKCGTPTLQMMSNFRLRYADRYATFNLARRAFLYRLPDCDYRRQLDADYHSAGCALRRRDFARVELQRYLSGF